ncbi:TauD/TfdA family dioxygenase [Bradyrhizobium daqingense]|uniref:Taurine dioxygenase n=1 Tax=Bradyrhizobium daqingense TaxID=993502 RepID=A0A562K9F8_9BRAD|nr:MULTISPECIES: TauD/TfdA family dioxygenase [Bradyrhizobium]TWH92059.1 taurine dioxygenase [Bradyrhizobium daqingense]UFS88987.1 TauD/TfdA family dioxygenase [Bradyrhizobium daqingense]
MSETMAVENVIPRADIVKHTDRLGAEIKNIALSDDLPDDIIVAFNRLLLEHKVIFFRDQGHLDDAQQQRFVLRPTESHKHNGFPIPCGCSQITSGL